ncbi:MAG TPA: tetratricopeptide repeat protein [Bryobacteraceae bacterium]|jgi:TolB-like protein/Flp pilus assembly protein TadD|nr:tetratricopeptide repeat protein [Bryobacteraceae bacterium]
MPKPSKIVRFGAFEANLETGELRKQGLKLRLPEQAFQILAMLLERPGEVVGREELRHRLWPGQTFFDSDHGINKAVNRLREALNDSAATPRFIETLARRGYRLIAPVSTAESSYVDIPGDPGRVRLAVLPFENLNGDPEHEFFSDGLTEEMISELGRLNPSRLGVIARTSSMQYKRTEKRIDEIGKELEVEYILEGSVRRAESRARITAQLIQVRDQTHLWAESYNRELADVLQVQHEVAQRVAATLAVELLAKASRYARPVSPEAYEAYLRGRFFWNQGTDRAATTAIEWFERALEQDPKYALAYSGIADCYGRLAWYGALPPREASPKAKLAATRALEIDGRLGEAHASMALVRFWYEWNWSEAEHEFQRAIDLSPNYAPAHNWYAAYLNAMQRFDQAAAEQKIAQELDPLSLTIAMNAADPYYFSRRYSLAMKHLERVLQREPNFFPAHYNLGKTYALAGKYQEAIAAFETAVRLSGVPGANTALGYAYARAGQVDQAQIIQKQAEELAIDHYIPAPQLVLSSLGLGEKSKALTQLEKGFEERSYLMIYLKADPIYDSLRSDPAFMNLLERMNFQVRWS